MDTVLWILWALGGVAIYIAAIGAMWFPFDSRVDKLYRTAYAAFALSACALAVGEAYDLWPPLISF